MRGSWSMWPWQSREVWRALPMVASGWFGLVVLVGGGTSPPLRADERLADVGPRSVLAEYLERQVAAGPTVARIEQDSGKRFADYSEDDYAAFLGGLELDRDDDLWTWSQLTGVPIVALSQGSEFFRKNLHLLADAAAAARMPAEERREIRGIYDGARAELRLLGGGDRSYVLRDLGTSAVRRLDITAQIRHNADFGGDRTDIEILGPYLARPRELGYRAELGRAIRSLPLPVVRVLRDKALYLSTARGDSCDALSFYTGSDQYPGYAGMQPGVFIEDRADGATADALLRGIGEIIHDTVLKGDFYGLYAYSLQYPGFQRLNVERRQVFGRRRDRLPRTALGFINDEARASATDSFVEHFVAYLTRKELFLQRAKEEDARGQRALLDKYRFMERLVEQTPTDVERLSRATLGRVDLRHQRAIHEGYLAGEARAQGVAALLEERFGKPFESFTEQDYARFMTGLDLDRDEHLWTWSHATGIPIVALNQRSNFFHTNAHLLEDVGAASLMSWSDLHDLRSRYDPATNRLRVRGGNGRRLPLRDLPADLLRRPSMDTPNSNDGAAPGRPRIVYEALEPYLVALADLENRQELSDGLRLLPLSIVKAHRGKAIYPTNRSKTGWAVSWPVSIEQNVSYAGMCSGSFVEPRRDIRRAESSAGDLVTRREGSLRGSSTDSLLHEVGHIIDSAVIGGRAGSAAFPHQFPEFRKLLAERNRIFGRGGDDVVPTAHGYVSDYAKTNARENFAEHFWAYLRDRDAFLEIAREEAAEGHPELLAKFRFMETLAERTPATMQPAVWRAPSPPAARPPRDDPARQQQVLAEYRSRLAERDSVVTAAEKAIGKPFERFDERDYARFVDGLDLTRETDLWRWSHVTGIPIVGLSQQSIFFHTNAHLLEDTAAARGKSHRELTDIESGLDVTGRGPTLTSAGGRAMKLRAMPADTLRRSERTGSFSHDAGFAEPRILLALLAPYLVPLREIPNRGPIADGLRALPLPVVKAYRGKAIYLTTRPGRCYAVGMPVSNSTYKSYAGMQTGLFVDRMEGSSSTHNLVHELGHVIDYAVIKGQYGQYLHTYQFPEFRKLRSEMARIFGEGSAKVPQTEHGYISRYAMTNAQESFAEHFAYYILDGGRFLELAKTEAAAGHGELMDKYRFLEKLLERTPTTRRKLSREYLIELGASRVGG